MTEQATELETRHYIGVTPIGLRMHVTYGPDDPDKFRDPTGQLVSATEPIPTRDGATLLYPVSAEVAAEWDYDPDDEPDEYD